MSVLICFALKEEAGGLHHGHHLRRGHHISILITGIGRANAEKAVREFLGSALAPGAAVGASPTAKANDEASFATREGAYAPELVLTCGFAGGLNPDLKVGDVVFEVQSPKSKVQSQLLEAGAKPAKFVCVDRVATTVADKKKLRDETGADVGEMESAAIHAVCAEHGIPCVTVRVISDTAHEDLPLDFNALAKPDKNIDYGKLAWTIAKSPGKIPALMKLQKQTQFAAQQLANVLEKIVER